MFSHSAIWVHPWLYRERECNLALSQRTYTSLQKNRAVMEIIVLGFSKACVCMKNAWGFHREALGWTRSCCFLLLHLELLKWNSVAHSCPVLRDWGICQTMLLRSGLKMVSVQLCSCNAETHLSSSCILEGSIRIWMLFNRLESIGKVCCYLLSMPCFWNRGLFAFIYLKGNVQLKPFHVSRQIMFQDKKTVP